ncbi:hypothetical protein Pcinc_000974 [Petrolisthes cinctipes]|uniref:Immunoglobulin I-set domain-containing protein n=1 Tax=Petrolisthes cinctipes TaxID=88211 RepID=A0AAE1GL04_PETCI|nr:hypothetical protein Pcinc_000974 [Petrolisthes cinctipes]
MGKKTFALVLWTRAGSVVGVSGWGNIDVGSDGHTLQVVRAGTHNADDYTCTANNQAGVIDIPVTLNVLVPPVIAWKKSGVMGGVGVGEGGRTCCSRVSLTPSRHWENKCGGVEFGGCGVSQVSPTDTTTLGTTIILPCPVTGSPPPQWLWYCGTQALVSTA